MEHWRQYSMSRRMKDSGIKWVGEIPEEWKLAQIKRYVKLYTGNSISDNEKEKFEDQDDAIPYISTKDINLSNSLVNYENGMYVKEIDYSFKRANLDSILLCIEGGSAGKKIALIERMVAFVNKLCCFESIDINSKYLFYFVQSPIFGYQFSVSQFGLMGGVSVKNISNFKAIIPTKYEQIQIANYLVSRCTLIDQAIEKQKQVIEKLKEYKQSVITEAVTKGLDPNVPMKDSGIEWIGEIPEHWDVKQVSSLFSERKCKNKGNSETNVLSLSYGNIKKRNVETNMGLLPESFETYNIIEPGNIVLRLTDLQNDHKSLRCGFVKENGIITSAYVTLEKKNEISEINTEYFYRLLHMFDIKKGFYGMGDGVRQNLKYNGELNKLLIVLPTVTEQNEIVDFLNKRCEAIDQAVVIKEAGIQKLDEYKKSLIYECVTGKREVK